MCKRGRRVTSIVWKLGSVKRLGKQAFLLNQLWVSEDGMYLTRSPSEIEFIDIAFFPIRCIFFFGFPSWTRNSCWLCKWKCVIMSKTKSGYNNWPEKPTTFERRMAVIKTFRKTFFSMRKKGTSVLGFKHLFLGNPPKKDSLAWHLKSDQKNSLISYLFSSWKVAVICFYRLNWPLRSFVLSEPKHFLYQGNQHSVWWWLVTGLTPCLVLKQLSS